MVPQINSSFTIYNILHIKFHFEYETLVIYYINIHIFLRQPDFDYKLFEIAYFAEKTLE